MKTILNNIPYTGSEYDCNDNISKYYTDGYFVATLDFDNDVFESFLDEDVEQSVLDDMYDEMVREKNRYESNKGYDVRSEQGLFGYGY